MKLKRMFIGLVSVGLTLNTVGMSFVYANDNPLSGEQKDSQEDLNDIAKKNDTTHKASENQPFDITGESYTLYASSKSTFNNLQEQYGSLDEDTNAGEGFKSYLKTIKEDKKNQQLTAQLNQMAQGGYDIKVSTSQYESLEKAVGGISDEDKQKEMDEKEKEATQQKENQVMIDEEYDSDIAFGSEFNNKDKQNKEEFDKSQDENNKNEKDKTTQQVKEFGESQAESDKASQKEKEEATQKDKVNTDAIKNNYLEQFKNEKKEADSTLSQKEQEADKFLQPDKTIIKNYNTLRNAIIASQKAVVSAGKSASATKAYADKIKTIIANSK